MCRNPKTPFLVGLLTSEKRAIVVRGNCDSWECEECATRKKAQWCARAIIGSKEILSNGMALQFCTVTSHPKLKSFAATSAVFPRAWGKLYAKMKREQAKFEYLAVMEVQKKNERLHMHMLTSLMISKRWLKDACSECGFGHQADVQKVEGEGHAAAYIAKYLGKSLEGLRLPDKFRRVRCSQGWAALPDLTDGQASDADWLVCGSHASLFAAVEECQKQNLTMIDVATGEYFDYGDAIEHWY